jgi:hypothetical protein
MTGGDDGDDIGAAAGRRAAECGAGTAKVAVHGADGSRMLHS